MPLPIQFLLLMLIGWVSHQQRDVIEYLQAENMAFREQLRGKRLRFTDAQRRRLARKAKPLGRRRLNELSTIVSPDALLRWYRELVRVERFDRRFERCRRRFDQTVADSLVIALAVVVRDVLASTRRLLTRPQVESSNRSPRPRRGSLAYRESVVFTGDMLGVRLRERASSRSPGKSKQRSKIEKEADRYNDASRPVH